MEEMADDNLFHLFHEYKNLSELGKAKTLRCPTDESILIIGHSKGELRLDCYVCNTRTTPGLALIDQVRAVVKEHNL